MVLDWLDWVDVIGYSRLLEWFGVDVFIVVIGLVDILLLVVDLVYVWGMVYW